MACVILESRETIIGEWEWIPKDKILNTKQNRNKIDNNVDVDVDNLREGFERVTIDGDKKVVEKKIWKETLETYFDYNIPNDLKKDKLLNDLNKLINELDELNNITDMIQVFIKNGFTLKNVVSNTVSQSIYTRYILVKEPPQTQTQTHQPQTQSRQNQTQSHNTRTQNTNFNNNNSGSRKNWNKKKHFGN